MFFIVIKLYYFSISTLTMNKALTFEDVTEQFKRKVEYQEFLAQSQQIYELKVYRVDTMSIKQAICYYNDLQDKYARGIYQSIVTSWYQNQRRLFIWFVICFIKLSGTISLQNQENWENISQVFFQKDVKLLKYQYQSILKRNARVQWTQQEDGLLIQVIRYFYVQNSNYKKGQWNQIAKELFFSGRSTQFKSPKHCRQRWNNHLNNHIKKDPWNDDEDLQMLNMVKTKGKKWSQIARQLNQKRTQHQIKNRFISLITNSDKKQTEQQAIEQLISNYVRKKQISKFTFFNNIIAVGQEHKQPDQMSVRKVEQGSQQKLQHITSSGMSFVYCGKKNHITDRPITTTIQDKLFGSNSLFFNDIKSQFPYMDRPIVHTPGHFFFQDSNCNFQRKNSDFKFRVDSKGSYDKSQIAASMQFLRPPRSDMSQQIRILSSSNSDLNSRLAYTIDFSNDIKEI